MKMKTKTLRTILKILLVVLLIGAGVSVGGIVYTMNQYSSSIKEYENLEQYVTVDNDVKVEEPVIEEAEPEEVQEEEAEPEKPSMIRVDFDMDVAALKAKNSDFIGWLYYEPLELSYPIVKGKGDDYYEHYSFEQEKNVAGAIFLDYLSKPNLESFNSIVYGHNMRNGTMFGSLNELITDPGIIEADPYFYIFTEKEAFMYQIVSAYYTPVGSDTYEIDLDYTLEDMERYVKYMESVSLFKSEEFFDQEVTEDMKICTLSTCHGLHSTSRTVVHGVLIAREERKTN